MAEPSTILTGTLPPISTRAVNRLGERLGEPERLTELRLRALQAYRTQEMPDRVRHLWRYSDPMRLLPAEVELDRALHGTSPPPLTLVPESASYGTSGRIQPGAGETLLLTREARAAGARLLPLNQVDAELDYLGRAVAIDHGPFEALNAAAWSAGAVLFVPAGAELEQPIHLSLPASAAVSIPRLLVVLERGARATVVEEHLLGEPGTRVVGVSELFVEEGASLRHVVLQRWGAGVAGHLTQRAVLSRDAQLVTVFASFGGSSAKADTGAVLAGEGARSSILGLVLGEGRQHMDHHTIHAHRARHTSSSMDIRAALNHRAHSTTTGRIRIEEDAGESEAYQENRNLLLSRRARAESIPELEILNHDVSCSHGATVAPLEEDPLFYLQSRGIPRNEAVRLAVRGFVEPILQRVPDGLRRDVTAAVEERIDRLNGGGR